MSTKTSPTISTRPPPSYSHGTPILSHHAPSLAAHITPASTPAQTLSTASFTDNPYAHIDLKHEIDPTPSASAATTATSTSIESVGPPIPDSGDGDSQAEVTPPPPNAAPKGKNGATGPAEGKTKPHLCIICGRGFTTGGHLQRHQRIHTGVKAFRCPFPGCDTKTSRQDNLQQHYRTHLSPTLRRGDGSQARAAVNAAMEAAGIKSASSRAPRRSKNSAAATTPSASSAAGSVSHLPSPYQTPTSHPAGPSPFVPYMFDPAQHGYPNYQLPPPPLQLIHPHAQPSATSSRVPSPVSASQPNAPAAGPSTATATLIPTPPHHPHQFYQQAFPPYGYPAPLPHQAYRHFPGLQNPYAPPHPHHPMFSPGGIPPEHAHHMYSPMQTAFPAHSREGSYSGMMTPGYAGPMANGSGYPSRTQTSTPISQTHGDEGKNGDITLSGYSRGHRPLSPISTVELGNGNGSGHHDDGANGDHDSVVSGIGVHRSGGSRRTPPHDMLSQGVVDPSAMHRSVHPGNIHPSYGYHQSPTHHINPYYGTPQSAHSLTGRHHTSALSQRASISSDGSGGGDGSQKASNSV